MWSSILNLRLWGSFPEPRVDSGWAWIVCFSSFMLQFLTYGLSNAYATMFVAFLQEFKEGEASTAWIGSTVFGLNFLLGPFSTALCDRWGCRSVAVISSFFLFLALVTTSYVTQFRLLYITYGLCLGVASSLGYSSSIIVLTKYFKRHISLATGIGMAGTGVGVMTITSVASIIIEKYGWRFALRCMSASSVIVLICGLTFRPLENTPKKAITKKDFLKIPRPTEVFRGIMKLFYDPRLWKNNAFIVWTVAIALILFANIAPLIFLTQMAADVGVPRYEASLLPGYLCVAQSFGKLLFGKLSDFHGVNRITLLQAALLTQATATTLCPLANTYWAIVMFTVIYGLTDGCLALMLGVGTYDVAGTEIMTRAFGCMSAVVSIPLMTGPVVIGLIYDISGTYSTGFFLGGGVTVAGVCLLFLIPLVAPAKNTEAREVLNTNKEKESEPVSLDPSTKPLLATEKFNGLDTLPNGNEILPVCILHSRPGSMLFLSAFPTLALSSEFLHGVGVEESEPELREDLYISSFLKQIKVEIEQYEEMNLYKNRSEEPNVKTTPDSLLEEDSSFSVLVSRSPSQPDLFSDRERKLSTDQYHWPYSTEEDSVFSEDKTSLSWDCFSELMEKNREQRAGAKPPISQACKSYNCCSNLMEEQMSKGQTSSCSFLSLHLNQFRGRSNDQKTGSLERYSCDQRLSHACETRV